MGREFFKLKFYDVWFEVFGKKEDVLINLNLMKVIVVKDGKYFFCDFKMLMYNVLWKVVGKDG